MVIIVNHLLIGNPNTPCFPYLRRVNQINTVLFGFQLLGGMFKNKCSHFLHRSHCQEVEMSIILLSIVAILSSARSMSKSRFQAIFSSISDFSLIIFFFQKVLFPSKIPRSSHHSYGDSGRLYLLSK